MSKPDPDNMISLFQWVETCIRPFKCKHKKKLDGRGLMKALCH